VQDELTRTNQEIIKARQAYYEESGELVRMSDNVLTDLSPEDRVKVEQVILIILHEVRHDLNLQAAFGTMSEGGKLVAAVNWFLDNLTQTVREIFLDMGQRKIDGSDRIEVDAIPVGEGDTILH
jgi:hypothetical protein